MKVKELIEKLELLNENGLGDLNVCTECMHDNRYFESLTDITLSLDEGDYCATPAVLISLFSKDDFNSYHRKLDEFDFEGIRKALDETYKDFWEKEEKISSLIFPKKD